MKQKITSPLFLNSDISIAYVLKEVDEMKMEKDSTSEKRTVSLIDFVPIVELTFNGNIELITKFLKKIQFFFHMGFGIIRTKTISKLKKVSKEPHFLLTIAEFFIKFRETPGTKTSL